MQADANRPAETAAVSSSGHLLRVRELGAWPPTQLRAHMAFSCPSSPPGQRLPWGGSQRTQERASPKWATRFLRALRSSGERRAGSTRIDKQTASSLVQGSLLQVQRLLRTTCVPPAVLGAAVGRFTDQVESTHVDAVSSG